MIEDIAIRLLAHYIINCFRLRKLTSFNVTRFYSNDYTLTNRLVNLSILDLFLGGRHAEERSQTQWSSVTTNSQYLYTFDLLTTSKIYNSCLSFICNFRVCVMRQCLISLSRLALHMVAVRYTITYLPIDIQPRKSQGVSVFGRAWYPYIECRWISESGLANTSYYSNNVMHDNAIGTC